MGHYAYIRFGPVDYSWKYHIPSIAAIMFEKDDFVAERQDANEDEEDWEAPYERLGFYANAEKVQERLEKVGISRSFLVDAYLECRSILREDWLTRAADRLWERSCDEDNEMSFESLKEARSEILRIWANFEQLSPTEELLQFCEILKELMSTDDTKFKEDVQALVGIAPWRNQFKRGIGSALDPRRLEDYFLYSPIEEHPPWLAWLYIFYISDSYFGENSDLAFMVQVLFSLEALGPKAKVSFELSDIIDEEDDAENILQELSGSLFQRMSIYRKLFFGILKGGADFPDQHRKSYFKELLSVCDLAEDTYSKGLSLERFAETLFTSSEDFTLQSKNLNIGDEELDLVLRNNVDRPFWNALGTACIFVECKNWKKPAGSKEFRDFSSKLENHQAVCKVGFFLALNGFTSEVNLARARLARSNCQIVLITRKDLISFFESKQSFIEWLSSLVARL